MNLQDIVSAYHDASGNQSVAARQLGLCRTTFQSRLYRAAEKGLLLDHTPAMPGYVIKSASSKTPEGVWIKQTREPSSESFKIPDGHAVKGVSALVDPDGRVVNQWIKTNKSPKTDPLAIANILKESFANWQPPISINGRQATPLVDGQANLLTLIPLADWHIGMYAWHREAAENWDLEIAENVIGTAIEDLINRTPASGTCVILGGGDLLHSDNNENRTNKSGNALQVDGRYPKCVQTACRLVVRTIDAALSHHSSVIVRILPGNHDEHTAIAVTYFLSAWYRNVSNVQVDTDPSLFWWYRFEDVLLGATHGHTVKMDQMPQIMAHRRAADWGATQHRYIHGFHVHHKSVTATEGGGCISEVHQAPIPQDAWHFGSGFLSGRSMQAITYDKNAGEIGRVVRKI